MKKLVLWLLLAGAALAGIGLWFWFPRGTSLSDKSLTYANIQYGTMVDVVSATGVLEPREVIVVASEMPGQVTALFARVGDLVSEGDALAQLDDARMRLKKEEADNGVRTAKAALAQAEAGKEAADIALKVQIELESKGGLRSDKEQAQAQAKAAAAGVQAAQARVRVAETALKEAELALELTRIKVPQPNGALSNAEASDTQVRHAKREFLVLDRKAQVGQMVGPLAPPLFTLAGDLSVMDLHAQVAEGDINKVKKGLNARFTVTGYGDEDLEFRGIVKEIRPQAANLKGAVFYDAVIEVRNQKHPISGEWQLRPGMTASVDIVRREHKNVWKAPTDALNFQLDEAYQTDAIRARLAEWKQRPDQTDWRALWIWDSEKRGPWPMFVRIGGLRNGEPGLKDGEGNEILEWELGREPTPANPPPRIIIGAPPARAPGFFDQPANIKVS